MADLTDVLEDAMSGEPEPTEEQDPAEAGPEGEPEGEPTDEPDPTEDEEQETPDDASDEPAEEPDAADEPEALPEDPRYAALLQQNEFLYQQVQLLQQRQAPPPPPPARSPEDDLPDNVLRAFLTGASAEQLQAIPPDQQATARKLMERVIQRQIALAKNPGLEAEEMVRRVMPEVIRAIQPVLQETHQQRVNGLAKKHLEPIKDRKIYDRALAVFKETPGVHVMSHADQDRALGIAVKAAYGEVAASRTAGGKQKTKAEEAQAKAAGGKKLKPAPRTGGRGPGAKVAPDMAENESFMDYARRLKKIGYEGDEEG